MQVYWPGNDPRYSGKIKFLQFCIFVVTGLPTALLAVRILYGRLANQGLVVQLAIGAGFVVGLIAMKVASAVFFRPAAHKAKKE